MYNPSVTNKYRKNHMHIEAITICINYADVLKWTLLSTHHQFNKMIVVTEENDKDTINLCQYYDVEYVIAEGNKGEKINAALDKLSKQDWVVHIDADIYLPPQTINIIRNSQLDHETIYGIDRCMCNSYDDFIEYLSANKKPYDQKYFTNPPFPVGTRISQHYDLGYIPIGYYQMWHPSTTKINKYPVTHQTEGAYARTDILMATQFKKRALLPSPLCIHLEEGYNSMGANWNGRTTPVFGPFNLKPIQGYSN